MSTAEFAARFNRRQHAALCATLICVGLILVLGGKVRDAVGILLLGMAFSWALGSNSRLVHWLFVVFGLLLLLSAALDGFLWRRNKPEFINGQISIIDGDRSLIEADRSAFADDAKGNKELSKDAKSLRELSDAYLLRPSSEILREYERKRQDLQEKIEKDSALSKDLVESGHELFKHELTLRDDERKLQKLQAERVFQQVMKNDWGTIVGGLLLLIAGLGLIVGVKPVGQNQPAEPR
jgi:uncharacterized integral membrane protein